jgi:hypothetical protein
LRVLCFGLKGVSFECFTDSGQGWQEYRDLPKRQLQ